jgi:integrase
MATTENRLSSIISDDGKSQIIVKLTINPHARPCFKSGVFIKPEYYKPISENGHGHKMGIIPPKDTIKQHLDYIETNNAKTKLDNYISRLLKICQVAEAKKLELSKDYIDKALRVTTNTPIDDITFNGIFTSIEKQKVKEKQIEKPSFFVLFEEYIQKQQHAFDQIKGHHVLMRILCRYEEYRRFIDKNKNFKLDTETINKETIEDFRDYISDEKSLSDEYPILFEKLLSKYPLEINIKVRSPKLVERGTNTVIKLMKKFKTFFNWLNKQGITNNHPFDDITIGTETYGTPIYITLEERNQIADYDLSNAPELAIQRDIFIFQSLIGCRVGDLLKMTKSNIVGDAIEYIAHKTKDERPVTLHVPLNDRAIAIVDKYKDCGNKLLPFITDQKYNVAIKKVFTACGITRIVTVLNPTTGEYEQKPINEVASSHMARRTFVGNLYKQVKDPNLVGALSGHVPGSKAFTRYRDIDNDMKKELVNLIK